MYVYNIFNFSIDNGSIVFAGLCNISISHHVFNDLIFAFDQLTFLFLTDYASEVDESYRNVLVKSEYKDSIIDACISIEKNRKIKMFFNVLRQFQILALTFQ